MESFIQKHAADVIGVLSGFDRLVFRGTLRTLSYVDGMGAYLGHRHVLLKDFGTFTKAVSTQVKEASCAVAVRAGRPDIFMASPKAKKEEFVEKLARRDHVKAGLVCVLRCTELAPAYDIFRNRENKRLELQRRTRPHQHIYHYFIHPRFGFMYARLQTWFPFSIQIGINGREWLSRQMDHAGLRYQRADNTFPWVEDYGRAQRLFDRQLTFDWPHHLSAIMRQIHPAHPVVAGDLPLQYYWSVYQSEWATDVSFRDEATLNRLYPKLVHHAMTSFSSEDVLRFLGHRLTPHGHVHGRFNLEVTTDVKRRKEGVRIKHRVGKNSLKAYNKANNLRVEGTMNLPKDFKVYRPREGDENGKPAWRPLRQGVADLHRRTRVCQAANNRYLDALAAVDNTTALAQIVDDVCKPTTWRGKRVRALQPWGPRDYPLLEAVSRGEFLMNGLRNRDLRPHLYSSAPTSKKEDRRRGSAVSRKLRLLRAHGLIAKVPKTHRYTVTEKGRTIITALLAARRCNIEVLTGTNANAEIPTQQPDHLAA